MSWERLDDVTKTVLARVMIDGDGEAATPPVSRKLPKRTASTKPAAKVTGQRQTTGETVNGTANAGGGTRAPSTMDRGMSVAAKAGRPTPATGIPMFMVVTGGRAAEEEGRRPAYRSTRRVTGSNWIRLVSG